MLRKKAWNYGRMALLQRRERRSSSNTFPILLDDMFIGYALFVWPVHWVFPLCLPCSLFTDKHHWRPALDITCTTCRLLFIFCQSGSVTTALGCGGWDWGMLNCEKKTSGEQTLFRPYWGVFVMLHASTRIFQHPAVLLLFP